VQRYRWRCYREYIDNIFWSQISVNKKKSKSRFTEINICHFWEFHKSWWIHGKVKNIAISSDPHSPFHCHAYIIFSLFHHFISIHKNDAELFFNDWHQLTKFSDRMTKKCMQFHVSSPKQTKCNTSELLASFPKWICFFTCGKARGVPDDGSMKL
jgi:hypothetical protein